MSTNDSNADDLETLLQSAASGNRQAFDDLFCQFQAYLLKVITIRMSPHLQRRLAPEDILQETYQEAFRRFHDFMERRPMPFRLWLRATAVEKLVQANRHHCSQKNDVGREIGLPDGSSFALVEKLFDLSSSPSQKAARLELFDKIKQSLQLLSEDHRDILVMRTLEGLTNQEVAQILNIESVTASQRYVRALRKLRELLAGLGLLEAHP